ncbi:SusE domain-containing protein [Fibrisoma limi]|nr:SusE domain-containing protein [Fibrisoma limi]
MKSFFQKSLLVGLALVTLSACEKDEERLVLQPEGNLALTASATTVTLTSDNAAKEAMAFSWPAASFGYPNAAVTYTVQFDKKGNDFKTPVNVSVGNALKYTPTVADLNATLIKLGLTPGTASAVDVRVKSDLATFTERPAGNPLPSVFSNVTSLTGTPYRVVLEYPSLWVPGDYQGWAPDKAPKIASVKSDGVYEGYVYFQKASPFKFTPAPNWDNDYGDAGAGKLKAKGSDLKVSETGYFLLKADLNALTWSATKTSWGVIGAATPKGWDASTPLTYDAATGTWQATLDLKADELKFRANDAWDINFGDGDTKNGKTADGTLDYGGDNLKVTTAGKYLITLDLSQAGNYTYTLKKQ